MSEEISKYELFNKYEEAKKLLLIDYGMNKDKRYLVAIEACEKQIPEKPYYLNYGGCNVGNWNHGIACICDYKARYCRYCGQRLDWEVDNED
jgi:hypothetical protein